MKSLALLLVLLSCLLSITMGMIATPLNDDGTVIPLPSGKPVAITARRDWTFQYSGAAPFCSQCGAMGAYACSDKANFSPLQQFIDYNHNGQSVVRVEAMMTGSYGCTSVPATSAVVAIRLNNIELDILNLNGGQQCKCNTCDGNVTYAKDFPYGMPQWAYAFDGSTPNNLTLTVYTGSICLNKVTLRVFYGTPTYPFTTSLVKLGLGANRNIPNGFCGSQTAGYDSGSFTFNDPLPAKSLLYSVDLVVYGTYFYRYNYGSYVCSSAQVSFAMNGFSIGGTQNLAYPRKYNGSSVITGCSQTGCDGQWFISLGQLYQNGVPNYRYGGANTLSFTGSLWTNLAFADIYLYSYPQPSN